MNILVTGASGFIGKRLIPKLIKEGHFVYAWMRRQGATLEFESDKISYLYGNLLNPDLSFPDDIDAAYYLVHSMSDQTSNFQTLEEKCAHNFLKAIEKTQAKQIIYLTGLIGDGKLSKHLSSRHTVEKIISASRIPSSVLRAGIIVGAGSASFELIRDLVEKLPIMTTPRWVNTRTQPISVRDTLKYLCGVLNNPKCFGKAFDIGGPDVLSFKDLMLKFAKARGLKRYILTLPFLTPTLSSYWIFFVSKVPLSLAKALVNSLKTETICEDFEIRKLLPFSLMSYQEAIQAAFQKIEQNAVVSSWIDSWDTGSIDDLWSDHLQVPKLGCLSDQRKSAIFCSMDECQRRIWKIGGKTGWYYLNSIWILRGWLDRFVGGVGLRRGRRHPTQIAPGDALDFWRVVIAKESEGHLLLYAEMKTPGEAWLEFKICKKTQTLRQTATFRPKGLIGRAYWYALVPFHYFIFRGMLKKLTEHS